ncbi:hypothetical protein [Salmonella phage Astrid]|uniref:Uncharacterized protein n=1 Tax=Salmonella phage Astrid TaxID=2483851 RepID=A0A3G8F2C2_9CAUD|nr:hypothetical protein [Salmonella phage Astrid]
MANVYRFTQADIDAAAAQGVTMKLSGLDVSDFDGFSDSDTLVATASGGRKFTVIPASGFDPAYTSIYFFGWNPSEGENMNISFVLSNNDTVATLKPAVGMNFTKFFVTTQAAAVALAWVNHPSSGSENTDIVFSWDGGTLTTGNYNVVVTKDGAEVVNISTPDKSYTLNKTAGDYVVTVYDKGGKSDSTASNISQAITLSAVLPKALYTVKAADITAISDNEIDMKVNGADITAGSVLRLGDVIVAKVSGIRKFYTDTTLHGTSINFAVFFDGESQWLQFALSDNDQTATFTMVDDTSGSAGTYQAWNIRTKQETPAVVGTNNVYKIDTSILSSVNKERFVTITGSDTPFDYGQYILSVLQFPFDIPADQILTPENIQLANRQLSVAANKVATDKIKIDLGEIVVPDTYGNMLSFANTNAVIHLPLAPSIVLDLEYVIGQTLGVYYLLDCYTGTATINITSTKLAAVISSTQVNIGVRVPYMADSYTAPENTGVVAGGNNGVKIPYIELISHDAILPHGFFTVPVVDETLISGQTGYIKVDNVELVTGALGNEKAQIISLLNSGVIIK